MKGPGKANSPTNIGQNYVFVGKPHNGDIGLKVASGWTYLTGNPYPSAMDANQFIDDNKDDIRGTIYFWEHWGRSTHNLYQYQAGYATYNFTGGVVANAQYDTTKGTKKPQRYIPVGQAFYAVGTTATPGLHDIKFNNSQRRFVTEVDKDKSIFLKTASTNVKNVTTEGVDNRLKIRLNFNVKDVAFRQILLGVDERATDGIDYGFDSEPFEVLGTDLFWVVNTNKLVIQAVDELPIKKVVPLGINMESNGLIKINVESIENPYANMKVYIRDNYTMQTYDILESTFEVYLEKGEHYNKYSVVFINKYLNETLEDVVLNEVYVFIDNDHSTIKLSKSSDTVINKIVMFNAIGQQLKVWSSNLESNNLELPINVSSGVYLLNIETNNGNISKKLFKN